MSSVVGEFTCAEISAAQGMDLGQPSAIHTNSLAFAPGQVPCPRWSVFSMEALQKPLE